MRQYAGFGDAAETNERFRYLLEQGTDRPLGGLRPADPDRLRLGPPAGPRARWAGSASRSTRSHDMRRCSTGSRSAEVSTSMTINATAAILLALYLAVAEEQGVGLASARRHGPERHPQGVHRPRHLHLPAGPVAAAGHRHHRLLRRAGAALEPDLDLRLPHPRGRLDGAAGGRLHPGQRPRLRRGGASTAASTSTASRPGCRSSSTPTTTSSRRWPSSAPPAGCGPN